MFDKIKEWLNLGGESKPKKRKIRRSDLEANITKIKEAMDGVLNSIHQIADEMSKLDYSTEEGRQRYSELNKLLEERNATYAAFQTELQKEYQTLKDMRASGKAEITIKAVTVCGTFVLSLIGIAVQRDNPSVLKVLTWLMKPFQQSLKI